MLVVQNSTKAYLWPWYACPRNVQTLLKVIDLLGTYLVSDYFRSATNYRKASSFEWSVLVGRITFVWTRAYVSRLQEGRLARLGGSLSFPVRWSIPVHTIHQCKRRTGTQGRVSVPSRAGGEWALKHNSPQASIWRKLQSRQNAVNLVYASRLSV